MSNLNASDKRFSGVLGHFCSENSKILFEALNLIEKAFTSILRNAVRLKDRKLKNTVHQNI